MLTHHDIKTVQTIVQASEERLIKKINTISDQIIEYTNTLRDTHEAWLRDHEKRITKLEDNDIYHS